MSEEAACAWQNSIVDLLESAYDDRLGYAKTYLKEYCPEYIKNSKKMEFLQEDIKDNTQVTGTSAFHAVITMTTRLFNYCSWHCYLVGRTAGMRGVKEGDFEDLDGISCEALYDLGRLHASVEYSYYYEQLQAAKRSLETLAGKDGYKAVTQLLSAMSEEYGFIYGMMYLLGFESFATETTLEPDNRARYLLQVKELKKRFKII